MALQSFVKKLLEVSWQGVYINKIILGTDLCDWWQGLYIFNQLMRALSSFLSYITICWVGIQIQAFIFLDTTLLVSKEWVYFSGGV